MRNGYGMEQAGHETAFESGAWHSSRQRTLLDGSRALAFVPLHPFRPERNAVWTRSIEIMQVAGLFASFGWSGSVGITVERYRPPGSGLRRRAGRPTLRGTTRAARDRPVTRNSRRRRP